MPAGRDLVAPRGVGVHRSSVRVIGGGGALVIKVFSTRFATGGEKEASEG